MSWQASSNVYRNAVKLAPKGGKETYHNVAKNVVDDTSDGTVDLPIANYASTPREYTYRYKTCINGEGRTLYSGYQTVTDGAGGGDKPSIMVIGDSFTIPSGGFPKHLDQTLDGLGYDMQLIDFAKSGNTAAQALIRAQSYLANPANELPDMPLIALGTNAVVQKLSPDTTEAKLDAIIDLFAARDIEVLLGEPEAHSIPIGSAAPRATTRPASRTPSASSMRRWRPRTTSSSPATSTTGSTTRPISRATASTPTRAAPHSWPPSSATT